MTYAESGLFWSQCFLPSLVIRKAQAGAGKSSLGLLWNAVRAVAVDEAHIVCHWYVMHPYIDTAIYYKF